MTRKGAGWSLGMKLWLGDLEKSHNISQACCFPLDVKRNFKEYDFWNQFQLEYLEIRMGSFKTSYVYALVLSVFIYFLKSSKLKKYMQFQILIGMLKKKLSISSITISGL